MYQTMHVFVPLSGLTSVNMFLLLKKKFSIIWVFVPLSGLTSVNAKQFLEGRRSFPVFVPLSGLTSVNDYSSDDIDLTEERFSSPYRG